MCCISIETVVFCFLFMINILIFSSLKIKRKNNRKILRNITQSTLSRASVTAYSAPPSKKVVRRRWTPPGGWSPPQPFRFYPHWTGCLKIVLRLRTFYFSFSHLQLCIKLKNKLFGTTLTNMCNNLYVINSSVFKKIVLRCLLYCNEKVNWYLLCTIYI